MSRVTTPAPASTIEPYTTAVYNWWYGVDDTQQQQQQQQHPQQQYHSNNNNATTSNTLVGYGSPSRKFVTNSTSFNDTPVRNAALARNQQHEQQHGHQPLGEEKSGKHLGQIQFKLDYDFEKSTLAVTVVQLMNLPAMDLSGTSDPYVKLYILPEKKKKFTTKVAKKTLNAVYNETFIFKVPYAQIGGKKLVLSVFDFDRFGKHDQIGEVTISLGSIDLAEVIDMTKDILEPPDNYLGEVCLALRYVPNKNRLSVVVMECKNLKKMDVIGSSDPYVKIYLMQGTKRVEKKKTTTKMRTLNPYYNESFGFEVTPEKMQRVHLIVRTMDYDRVGSNDAIGQIMLGAQANGTGQKQWMDMLATPRRSVAQWHVLEPIADD